MEFTIMPAHGGKNESIPGIIHLTCADKAPPPRYSFFIDRIRSLHPLWEIRIWDDVEARAIVHEHFPELEEMYVSYTVPIQRVDIFRVMLMYLFGGFYMDLDMLCFRNLDELCKFHLVLGIEKILSADECDRLHHLYSVRIANYMFGSRPQHRFWLDLLMAAKGRSGEAIHRESDVLETTGPGLLTNVFHETRNEFRDITLLPNTEHPCRGSCGPASCHFGDFAAHLHLGTWRWENQHIDHDHE